MAKLDFKARTLDEEIVRDGLCAISALGDYPQSRGMYYVVGGVATQSYLPSSCRRPTSDIDLVVLRPLTKKDFHTFAKGAANYLYDRKYGVELKKGHNSYYLVYVNKENEANMIEFARHNEKHIEKIKERLAGEVGRLRNKIIENRAFSCPFASPEDIAVPKIARSINSMKRNPKFKEYIGGNLGFKLSDEQVKNSLSEIAGLREEAQIHAGDLRISETLRFVSDLYDIRLLSELAGFNEFNFKEAASNWDSIRCGSEERDFLFSNLLPQFRFMYV